MSDQSSQSTENASTDGAGQSPQPSISAQRIVDVEAATTSVISRFANPAFTAGENFKMGQAS
jgi:hypothetical protein